MTTQIVLNQKIYTSDDMTITAILETPQGVVPPMTIDVMLADPEAILGGDPFITLKSNWARLMEQMENPDLTDSEFLAVAKELTSGLTPDERRIITVED